MVSLALAFIAGVLSVLSPCVLPILPIILATAVSRHRFGAFALTAGLATSFVIIGLFVSLVGFAIGLDGRFFRSFSAVLLIAIGLVLIVPRAQMRFAANIGSLSDWGDSQASRFDTAGLIGQFIVGTLLGAIWTPCVGPTLGAASLLAARGENLGYVFLVMVIFGLGASLPLLVIGSLSRGLILRLRDKALTVGWLGKGFLGLLLIGAGIMILAGFDKSLETQLVAASPQWLTHLTTGY